MKFRIYLYVNRGCYRKFRETWQLCSRVTCPISYNQRCDIWHDLMPIGARASAGIVLIKIGPLMAIEMLHDDVIKWKHFPRYWPFVRGIHRSPVNSPHKGQWRGALMFSSICTWINGWENNREAGDLRRHRAHYDVTVMVRYLEILSTILKNIDWTAYMR